MPWKESGVLEEKMRFVMDQEKGLWTMTELCQRYGISREGGYQLVRRFREIGIAGLLERNRAPLSHPNQTAPEIVEQVLALRRQRPSWGPKKLRGYLERKCPQRNWPARSTIGEWLKAEGLVVPRRKRRKTPPYTQPFVSLDGSNQVWCADFKGWFRARNGERIDPLTMSDAYSRYLLRCQAVDRANTEQVKAIFEAAFREYGMPLAIRSDNGAPFASRAIAGLSRLAVYLMKLDIIPERIEPGHPEQNGRHERMHRTLQQETAQPPAANRRDQQKVFDRFRQEYNHERPHEALGQQTPASCYQSSPRQYPSRLPVPEYEVGAKVRSVEAHGDFFWQGDRIFLSETLAGEQVGVVQVDDRYSTIFFRRFPIARLDNHKRRVSSWSQPQGFYREGAKEGETAPFLCTPSPTTKTNSG
jgi:putative transposase